MSRENPNVRNSRDIRYVSIEPGRISLHGIALTENEYAVLRGIAERMKRSQIVAEVAAELTQAEAHYAEPDWINEVPTC